MTADVRGTIAESQRDARAPNTDMQAACEQSTWGAYYRAADVSDAEDYKRQIALRVRTLGPRIYHVACRALGSAADAEDVVQLAFLDAVGAIDEFRGEASLDTWIWRIAHRRIGKALRRRSRKEAPVVPLESLGPLGDAPCIPMSEETIDRERLARLSLECLGELPAADREILAMRDLEGLSNMEVAGALDLSLAAVKSRIHRARLMLRRAVNLRQRQPTRGAE
ncbi:MAG: RNA polymerase sigma factor [Nannocystaceae bacterium]|nr:RNA polymerase sigma factor [Nannocystaceae bacterium]